MIHALRHIRMVTRMIPWEGYALAATVGGVITGAGLALYPDVYSLSKSYDALASTGIPAPVVGLIGLASSSWVLAMLRFQSVKWGLYGLLLYLSTLMFGSLISVGPSGGTGLYFFFAACIWRAFRNSGGLTPRA